MTTSSVETAKMKLIKNKIEFLYKIKTKLITYLATQSSQRFGLFSAV